MKIGSLFFLPGLAGAVDLLFHEQFTGYEYTLVTINSYQNILNFTYEIATAEQWDAMTTNDFKKYKAIILGDSNSGYYVGASDLNIIMANRKTWGAAIEGNVIIIGTDPPSHESESLSLVTNGITFAATGKEGTGLYFTLSEYYQDLPATPVPILDIFGKFVARGDFNGETYDNCFDNVHIVVDRNPVLEGIPDAELSNWQCSVHEAFVSYPSTGSQSFVPLAIAKDVPGAGSKSFTDGTRGIPYILVRGATPIGCGNGILDPDEECDDGNTINGDGCNSACRFENGGPAAGSPGRVAGGVIGGVAGITALSGLVYLVATKTALGAKAAAAAGIGSSAVGSAAGGGGGAGGATGATGAMFVPTGLEGKAAAAVASYVPTGMEGKAAAQVTYMPGVGEKAANAVGHAASGAAQATQGLSSAVVPPPTDGGLSTSTAAAGINTATSAGINATTTGVGATASAGANAAVVGGSMAPGVGMQTVSSMAAAPGSLAPGLASAPGVGTAAGMGGGLSAGKTVGQTIVAGFAGLGAALLGRRSKTRPMQIVPSPPVAAFDDKEVNSVSLSVGVQEVAPTPSGELQSDPISRVEMEQPYVPPPPPAGYYKEYGSDLV